MDLDALNDVDETHLMPTPENILSPSHPMTDPFLRELHQLKRAITVHAQSMKARHVEIVKRVHAGDANKKVADELGIASATVGKVLRSPAGQELTVLLMQLTLLQDGPLEMQRRHMLWRIACNNEKDNPRVAIAAIAEMNKTDYQRECLEKGMTGGGTVEIVINAQQLPRGPLDAGETENH